MTTEIAQILDYEFDTPEFKDLVFASDHEF